MNSYIGRQPLYNKDYVLCGYDLLHRDNVTKSLRDITSEDEELRRVFSDAISMFDFDALTEGLNAHMRFTKNLLLSNFPYLAPPERLVVEISADTQVDAALAEKLNDLKVSGYRLAINGYDVRSGIIKFNKILHLFDFVYINAHQNNRLQIQELMKNIRLRSHARLLAEQVDTEADFDKVKDLHFTLFQGLLFGMPSVFRNEVNLGNTPYGKLYNELAKPASSFENCCRILEQEPVLNYMFLQKIPGPREREDLEGEIRRSMMTVGTERLRKWSCLLMLKQLNVSESNELSMRAYRRAWLLERVMEAAENPTDPTLGFLLGIFSLLPEICDTPLESITGQLRLDAEVRSALTKKDNVYAAFLDYITEYEQTRKMPAAGAVKLNKGEAYLVNLFDECDRETETAFNTLNPFLTTRPQAQRKR